MKSLKPIINNINPSFPNIIRHKFPLSPPWLSTFNINTTLSTIPKKDSAPSLFKHKLTFILHEILDHTQIYTDGSITKDGVDAAVLFQEHELKLKFP